MAETITSVAMINTMTTSVTGIGIAICGIHTGLDYAVLFPAIAGSAFGVTYLKPSSKLKRAMQTISASLLAGYASPILAHVVTNALIKLSLLKESIDPPTAMQALLAFTVGWSAHSVIFPGMRKIGLAYTRKIAND